MSHRKVSNLAAFYRHLVEFCFRQKYEIGEMLAAVCGDFLIGFSVFG